MSLDCGAQPPAQHTSEHVCIHTEYCHRTSRRRNPCLFDLEAHPYPAGFRVVVLESLACVAPASPRELARVLAALQSSLMRDAAMPSYGGVVSVAALGAACRLATAFPAARANISSQLAVVSACSSLSPQARSTVTA